MTPNVKTRLEGMAMKARYNNTKENLMFANVGQQLIVYVINLLDLLRKFLRLV